MPYLRLPDNSYVPVPEGMSYEEALQRAQQKFPELYAEEKPKSSLFAETIKAPVRGFVGSVASMARGLGAILPESMETPFAQGVEAAKKALSPRCRQSTQKRFRSKQGKH